jgi:hypothetical protein
MHFSGTALKDSGVAGMYFASLSHALASGRKERSLRVIFSLACMI